MKSTIDSDFGLMLNPGPDHGPRRLSLTCADLHENVQVYIPTKEELEDFLKEPVLISRNY